LSNIATINNFFFATLDVRLGECNLYLS